MSSAYEPLTRFLAGKGAALPMRFREIEQVLGRRLPRSAYSHRAWWSNNPTNNPMTKAWLEAGYESEQVDMAAERLVFRRVRAEAAPPVAPPAAPSPPSPRAAGTASAVGATGHPAAPAAPVHPLHGVLHGSVTLVGRLDLTAPADPDWGGRAEFLPGLR